MRQASFWNVGRYLLLGGCQWVLAAAASAATPVYSNLDNPLGVYLGGFGPYGESADDVTLAGGGLFESARVGYAGINFDGDETLTLNLYRMNGAPTPNSGGANTPGDLLFSQTIPILPTGSGFADFVDLAPSISLPAHLGVGLIFGGVAFDLAGTGGDAGPTFADPPTLGSSAPNYWLRDFNGDPDWAVYDFGGNPIANYAIEINVQSRTQVPEAGSSWALLLGGLGSLAALSAWVSRRSRSRTSQTTYGSWLTR